MVKSGQESSCLFLQPVLHYKIESVFVYIGSCLKHTCLPVRLTFIENGRTNSFRVITTKVLL